MSRPLRRPCTTKANSFLNKPGLVLPPLSAALNTPYLENENIALQSNALNLAAWAKTRSSIPAANAVGPDGSAAFTWSEDATATSTHTLDPSPSLTLLGKRITLSVNVKPANRAWVALQLGNGTDGVAWFNCNTGVIGTVSGKAVARILQLGVASGWYRIFLTCPLVTGNNNCLVLIGSADNTSSFTGLNQSSIFIQKIQVKNGDPDEYLPTVGSVAREKY